MNLWLVMIGAGLFTYLIRFSFIALFGWMELIPIIRRALRFVPAAVLSAIIFPELWLHDGHLDISLGNARLLAGALATLVAWRTKNVVLTILAGMVGLILLQFLLQ